jgi:hypothetical protein
MVVNNVSLKGVRDSPPARLSLNEDSWRGACFSKDKHDTELAFLR